MRMLSFLQMSRTKKLPVVLVIDQRHINVLVSEVQTLRSDWELYRALFMQGPHRAHTLNRISADFFHSVHRNLIIALITRISKLTDPAMTLSQSNLTMEYLKLSLRR